MRVSAPVCGYVSQVAYVFMLCFSVLLVGSLFVFAEVQAQNVASVRNGGRAVIAAKNANLTCPAFVFLGEVINFTGQFENIGTENIDNVSVAVTTTAELSMSAFTTSQGTWTPGTHNATLAIGTVAPGVIVTYGFDQTAAAIGVATFTHFLNLAALEQCNIEVREPTVAISGMKFNDSDSDGILDGTEVGIPDWTIYLDTNLNDQFDDGEPTATTDENGEYRFDGLPPGAYVVGEVNVAGWSQTSPGGNGRWSTQLPNPGDEAVFVDFGNVNAGGTDIDEAEDLPKDFQLHANYPNPFNPTTTISFDLKRPEYVTLRVYDLQGRLITTLVDGIKQTGPHEVVFSSKAIGSGTYAYRLQAGAYSETKLLTVSK